MDSIKKNNIAFTLIELLVVVALVSMLACLLAPALSGARESASQAKCINNLRQIHLALTTYYSDNNENMPQCRSSSIFPWWTTLQPYFGVPADRWGARSSVILCPINEKLFARTWQPSKDVRCTYVFTAAMSRMNGSSDQTNFKPLSAFKSQNKIIVGECAPEWGVLYSGFAYPLWPGTWNASQFSFCHKKRMNSLYLDGHVDSIDSATLSSNYHELCDDL
ncbi:MAG: type II secretion system protein [Verrucomicrobiae bacterium]|nr:type II secretion system protein [Verrucomicrobiae bacterium]